jgi:3-oxoacyl-[acyl-carrier-protein] synthase-3
MVRFRFQHVCLEAFSVHLPDHEVSSAELEDRLSGLYERLRIPFGTLERLSGIRTRRLWDKTVRPSTVATEAARQVIDKLGSVKSQIKALINCSVTRDFFEPATAAVVHGNLKLPEESIVMDISNACMGFMNGIAMLGSLIESGVVKAGVLVSGENVSSIIESSIGYILNNEQLDRDELIRLLPSFTLGCAAVAFVLCHDSVSTTGHRILGATGRSATQFNDLCEGNADHSFFQSNGSFSPIMYTESSKIISSAATLGGRTWRDASELLGWSKEEVDHIFCHQVGRQVNEAFYQEMGLDIEKEYTIYQKYGNLVSASLPVAFAEGVIARAASAGDKVLLTGFGSGLNSLFVGIEW